MKLIRKAVKFTNDVQIFQENIKELKKYDFGEDVYSHLLHFIPISAIPVVITVTKNNMIMGYCLLNIFQGKTGKEIIQKLFPNNSNYYRVIEIAYLEALTLNNNYNSTFHRLLEATKDFITQNFNNKDTILFAIGASFEGQQILVKILKKVKQLGFKSYFVIQNRVLTASDQNNVNLTPEQIIEVSKNTAITRKKLRDGYIDINAPLKLLLKRGFIKPGMSVLDYGAGKGNEIKYLRSIGVDAVPYDINYFPEKPIGKFDIVMCNYVLNVVTKQIRDSIVEDIKNYAKSDVFIAVRNASEKLNGQPYEDGMLMQKGKSLTFQKLFTAQELQEYLSQFFSSVEIISRNPLVAHCRV